jgi:hypothetical protein
MQFARSGRALRRLRTAAIPRAVTGASTRLGFDPRVALSAARRLGGAPVWLVEVLGIGRSEAKANAMCPLELAYRTFRAGERRAGR